MTRDIGKVYDPENTVVHKGSKSLAMKHISYHKSYKQITNGHTHQSHKTALIKYINDNKHQYQLIRTDDD